ncbi:family 20 glycosylhydrolase [Streptomyces sp. NPDC021080]|uniref:family 20 glycosylhydrolase n=1 Tax=Streptomyces sp. NPDC021080 TaxID=3365110 RepID=UPI0037BABBC3
MLSPTSPLYLDHPYAEPSANADDEARRAQVGLAFYPPKQVYGLDPGGTLATTPDREATATGTEATVWRQTTTSVKDLEFLLLPRLTGIAERAWSPAASGERDGYRGRLAAQSVAWRHHNWTWFASTPVDWLSHPSGDEEA